MRLQTCYSLAAPAHPPSPGVLVDTERDGHRVSFNKAFQQLGACFPSLVPTAGLLHMLLAPSLPHHFHLSAPGIPHEWDVATYGKLLEIGGGKERMMHYFGVRAPLPAPAAAAWCRRRTLV